ncbi:rod shape-determining protein [Candidatus Kaiserbacteria bacterium]|nr:rod shape-determining protein [Candidatus Kaiserbacteria bacterium]
MAFSFAPKLGIDLGTTTVLVFVPGKGIVLNEPSVVAVSQRDNKILAIGDAAKNMIGRTPDEIIAYRPMKDGVIADYRVTEAMLRYYIRKALGKWNLFRPEVMISVPAGVTSTERRAVVEAATKAGAREAYVVKEPILAAIGAGIPIQEAHGHMIVDIGGGTTDVAVISLGGIVASTSVKCAGNRIDRAIADYIKKSSNLGIGDKMAEEIKIHIGSAVPVEDELTMVVKGRDHLTGLPRSLEIGTNDVVRAIGKELRVMVNAIKDVLQETPPELAADIIDNGITMTGGSSQLRNLAELIYRRTGVKAHVAKDAPYCVAKGTGEALKHLDTYKKAIISKR